MKDRVKNKIIKELSYYNISIDYKELDEVCGIFEHLIAYGYEVAMKDTDVCKELEVPETKEYYSFATKLIPDPFDQQYLDLLVNLIILKRNNLLQYVDYGLLTYGFASSFSFNHPVCILADFTQQLVLNIDNPDVLFTIDTYRYKYLNFDSWYCNDWFTCLFSAHIYTLITKSNLISQDYKDIINCYNEMYNSYWDFSFNNDITGSEDDKFEKFMICSYYYFAFNNKINSEKDRIISFINGLITNPEFLLDSLKMNGIEKTDDILNYIHHLYSENNNSLRIK